MKYDLSVGNAVCVREAFLKKNATSTVGVTFPLTDKTLNYGPHEGNSNLINITRQVIERQTGLYFRHILLTNGATGAISLALRMYSQKGYAAAVTKGPPYFPLYPLMIKSAGLKHGYSSTLMENHYAPIILVDCPSNPLGDMLDIEYVYYTYPTIWDAVYANKVYTSGKFVPISCNVIAGSYSKLLGLNGLRTGWLGTDDDELYAKLRDLVTVEYAGLSAASEHILLTLLSNYKDKDWERFETQARNNLDDNRIQWSRLEKFFNGWGVNLNGMFHYSYLDSSCKKLLEKSGIVWTPGSVLGTDDSFGRFNLGASCQEVKEAVKEILKQDKI